MRQRPILFSPPMVRALLDGTKTQTRRVVKPQPFNGRSDDEVRAQMRQLGALGPDESLRALVNAARDHGFVDDPCPYGEPGDRLYVREAWRADKSIDAMNAKQIATAALEAGYPKPWAPIQYEADGMRDNWVRHFGTVQTEPGRYRHARFMPRWASRITLEITDIRVERLQDISEADAIAEGVERIPDNHGNGPAYRDYYLDRDDVAEWFSNPVDSYRTLWESINGAGSWEKNRWVWVVEFKRV